MAVKTITIEVDAYELLKSRKRGERDSFSQVIRREFGARPLTGPELLGVIREYRATYGDLTDEQVARIEDAGSDHPLLDE